MFRTLICAATAASALLATPAEAQSMALTKASAILGGQPSALAAILAAQGSPRASAPFAYASGSVPPAASLFRNAPLPARPAPALAIASPDRPDVFNSVALPVGRTPLTAKWKSVEYGAPTAAAAAFATRERGVGAIARAEAINAYVNARVRFVDDFTHWHVADKWSPAAETLASGKGDCEDYAIAKLAMLRRAGFAEHDLYLVVLKDLVRRADHAVAVVRADGRFLVLDNGTDRLIDSDEIGDYRPIMSFTAGHAYVHGYRRDAMPAPAPVIYASARATAPLEPAAGEGAPSDRLEAKPLAELTGALRLPLL
ncbi:transglutaminase-like cysteine peptidase [Sphingomonas sp. ASV193]|uniref:transglutaminase-like cysteine peptidase n=1 Tax=Sphingomonas sp. ASV193 TaxID=3144405 RepID=UPI0032E90518